MKTKKNVWSERGEWVQKKQLEEQNKEMKKLLLEAKKVLKR